MARVKVCGLTRREDVQAALDLGADMLGFIHVPKSPRHVSFQLLKTLLEGIPEGPTRVIVVQDAEPDLLKRLRGELSFDWFQFHGSEPPPIVREWRGYKVFHVRGGQPQPELIAAYQEPILLDTQVGGRRGGTGQRFDWAVLRDIAGKVIVAGGLTPENVGSLVREYQPWGVDVSSGVESAPGVKDHRRMQQFIETVRSASAP